MTFAEKQKAYIEKQRAKAADANANRRKLTEEESEAIKLQEQGKRSKNQYFGAADEESF